MIESVDTDVTELCRLLPQCEADELEGVSALDTIGGWK